MFRRIRCSVVLLSVIALCSHDLSAQKFVLSASAGYGTFGMKGLKDQQRELAASMPVPGKIVQSFPGYINYYFDFVWQRDSVYFGFLIGHTSTGGRVTYADYSGHSTRDQTVGLTYYGIQAGRRIWRTPKTGYFVGIQILEYLHTLRVKTEEVVLNEPFSSTAKYDGSSLAIGPYIEARHRFREFLFKARGAYEFHVPGNYNDAAKTSASASGLRITLGAGYVIK